MSSRGNASRSMSVFSNSARVIRRIRTRPSRATRAASIAVSFASSSPRKARVSSADGRAFFFGGISPLAMRSCTFTHVAKFVRSSSFSVSAVKSSPPFFVSASWQSVQCCAKKAAGAAARAETAASVATHAIIRPKRIMKASALHHAHRQRGVRFEGEFHVVGEELRRHQHAEIGARANLHHGEVGLGGDE
jgi:hypothetical protein